MIQAIKLGSQIFSGIEAFEISENGEKVWNVPENLEEFRAAALDTINWQIAKRVKSALGNMQSNFSAANAKAIVLLTKLIDPSQKKLDALSDLERDSYNKMTNLAANGYADSQLLNTSLTVVTEQIAIGTDKAARIAQAADRDAIIEILNEGW